MSTGISLAAELEGGGWMICLRQPHPAVHAKTGSHAEISQVQGSPGLLLKARRHLGICQCVSPASEVTWVRNSSFDTSVAAAWWYLYVRSRYTHAAIVCRQLHANQTAKERRPVGMGQTKTSHLKSCSGSFPLISVSSACFPEVFPGFPMRSPIQVSSREH